MLDKCYALYDTYQLLLCMILISYKNMAYWAGLDLILKSKV